MRITSTRKPAGTTHLHFLSSGRTDCPPDFDAAKGAVTVRYDNDQTIIYCGLGDESPYPGNALRSAAANGIRRARKLKRRECSLVLSENTGSNPDLVRAAVEGAVLGSYSFTLYKSETAPEIKTLNIAGTTIPAARLKKWLGAAQCVNYARDLINTNASTITPARLATEARALSKQGISVSILTDTHIAARRMGLIQAVGQGSPWPPRIICMTYRGAPRVTHSTAVLGKGVTFDSGGQNLKPSGSIETMRCDMSGAATVLGLMKALAILKPKVNVIGCIGAAHNAIGANAYFPGDVYRSYSGKTVEITNTDAEGRLVLADTMTHVIRTSHPDEIIDLATLTGGVLSALGDRVAGLFSTSDTLAESLFTAGEQTNERLWRFPVYDDYREAMKSETADLRNTAKWKRGHASSITGAAFLSEFTEGIPWAHIDIAGTAFNENEVRGEIPRMGTGFGVRLLLHYLESRATR